MLINKSVSYVNCRTSKATDISIRINYCFAAQSHRRQSLSTEILLGLIRQPWPTGKQSMVNNFTSNFALVLTFATCTAESETQTGLRRAHSQGTNRYHQCILMSVSLSLSSDPNASIDEKAHICNLALTEPDKFARFL